MRERTPLPRSRLARFPRLELVVTTGMANAAIDVQAATGLGVTVCGTRGSPAAPAELTWALILALLRHVPAEDAALRAGGWQHTVGTEVEGRTLGVIGLGRIGSRVAAVGRAFGMDVLAWSPHLDPAAAAAQGVAAVGKDELLERSDVVTLHLRLSPATRGVIGARELGLLQPTAYLVNTSRGPLVDEDALIAALRAGRLAGAALDVFDVEPLPPSHPLRTMDGLVLTPHVGYVTRGNYERWYADVVEDIAAWLDGAPLRVL